MRNVLLILSAAVLAFSGCIIHDHHRGVHRSGLHRAPTCHPSEYWDGEHCVHKGKKRGHHKDGHHEH